MTDSVPKPPSALPQAANTADPGAWRFFSLKWKILLSTGTILFVVVGAFGLISYLNLENQFEQEREARHRRYTKEMEGLIEQSARHLHELGGTIPYLDGMAASLLSGSEQDISHSFEQHWGVLQLQSSIESVRFYNRSNQSVSSWGAVKIDAVGSSAMLKWAQRVNDDERPLSVLACEENCMQYAAMPLHVSGKKAGTVILGGSLVDAVLGFKRVSGNEIGLLIHGDDQTARDTGKLLSGWNARVVALTGGARSATILDSATRQEPDFNSVAKGVQILSDGRYYEVRLLPLHGFGTSDRPHLVVIADITSAIVAIRNSTVQGLIISVFGLLIAETMLFFILTGPLSRLQRTVHTLPLLARGAFETVRQKITRDARTSWSKDEIDTLDDTAIALSHQLEELENRVTEKTQSLSRRMDDLGKERDFIKNLLDTAQVVVLTQNGNGEILTLNKYATSLLQYDETEIQGRPFESLISPKDMTTDLKINLTSLQSAQKDQLRHEAITFCKDGSLRHITWLHSRLSGRSKDDQVILSVGLDTTERRRVESRLSWLADHDTLTGLFNRRRFQEELERLLNQAKQYQHTGALLFFDLDQFKYINDTSGHQAGDELLKVVAKTLMRIVRTTDVVARLGGDEFAVLLPGATSSGAVEVVKKIAAQLNSSEIAIQGRNYKISASIGIAMYPEHGTDVDELLAVADLAMYQAKESGLGGWHLFSSKDKSRERLQQLIFWKENIEQALLEDRFTLYYQPILNIRTKTIHHYEVLLRMRDRDGTIIAPNSFIPIAERTGLIHAIDHMVLRKAIAQAAEINHRHGGTYFSLNLSGRSFNDPELLSVLKDALAQYRTDPASLIFEITETAAVSDLLAARTLMESVMTLGCRFALDDFGVGFSSFYYLKQLPVDYVKIDGSFIRNLTDNPDDQILVKALIDVARGFGKKTTAEFVENAAILALLEEYQVDFAQGYYIGKPAPAENFFSQARAAVV